MQSRFSGWKVLSDLLFSLKNNIYWDEAILRGQELSREWKSLSQRTQHHQVSNPQELWSYFTYFNIFSGCNLAECRRSCHLKGTKMIFQLRTCLNQNTSDFNSYLLLNKRRHHFPVCMMSCCICTCICNGIIFDVIHTKPIRIYRYSNYTISDIGVFLRLV